MDKTRFTNSLLTPLSTLYGLAISLRNLAYDSNLITQHKVSLPVISVGNLTTGGTGKSPFVQYLVERLIETHKQPVILMRGYGGSCRGPYLVSNGDRVEKVGDEALMHKYTLACPVVIARRRVSGAQFIEKEKLGEIIILDDGFQHRQLKRDCNLLLVDVSTTKNQEEWIDGHLLPKGRFREQQQQALKRADGILLVERGHKALGHKQKYAFILQTLQGAVPTFQFLYSPKYFRDAASGETCALNTFEGTIGRAVTGIAGPEGFCSMLTELGITLESRHFFRDHHLFSEADYDQVRKEKKLPIFTTAKDAVKLGPFVKAPQELFVLMLHSHFVSKAQEVEFWVLVERTC